MVINYLRNRLYGTRGGTLRFHHMGRNGKSIKKALKKIEDLEPVYENLKIILNRYLIPGVIPEEITTSRLFCLNKKADEVII